jgi:hypothetical protein
MQQQLIQFLAALANGRTRGRFAAIAAAGPAGVAPASGDDALLIAAGVVQVLDDARVRICEPGIRTLLGHAREGIPAKPQGKVDLLPRQHTRRLEVLRGVADRILGADERIPERELNARLEGHVMDIPGVRRALIDEGILEREADGSAYWRAGEG